MTSDAVSKTPIVLGYIVIKHGLGKWLIVSFLTE